MDKEKVTRSTTSLGSVTAKSWAIMNADTGEIIQGKCEKDRREIASLTKVMTAYTTINIITRLDINILASKVEVSFDASMMGGTSAELIEGDVLSIWDMLHAMLLPSGNDAAYALAEYFGLLLMEIGTESVSKTVDPVQVFIAEMNKNAKNLGLTNTNYANPHGLQNSLNKSTALDVGKLCSVCMKFPLFAEIVKKPKHTCVGQDMDGSQKYFIWFNTNKLLDKGFNGLKTGITTAAGFCLAASCRCSEWTLIIIVLACKTSDSRWSEIPRLRDVGLSKLMGETQSLPAIGGGKK